MGFVLAAVTAAFALAGVAAAVRYSRRSPRKAVRAFLVVGVVAVVLILFFPDFVLTALIPWLLVGVTAGALIWLVSRAIHPRRRRSSDLGA